jgi:hypothetical protein
MGRLSLGYARGRLPIASSRIHPGSAPADDAPVPAFAGRLPPSSRREAVRALHHARRRTFANVGAMLRLLRRLFADPHRDTDGAPPPAGTGSVTVEGHSFDFAAQARWHDGVPHPDWDAAATWLDTLPAPQQAAGWLALQRGWLDWLRGVFGLHYRLHESDTALLLTTQPARLAQVKLGYLGMTLRRIERTLEEIADHDLAGKEILIAFADEDDYYRYVSGFYPEDGTFGMSAGMHLGGGCGHFVTHGLELERLEPTIVHEMTHSCVRHLPLPLWLNEGLAQAIEGRFAPTYQDPHRKLEELRRQAGFWSPATIQEFWSGHAFGRPDDRQKMAYLLALSLTDAFAQDWPRFKAFVLHAHANDAGAAAAREWLDLDLGEYLRLFLERDDGAAWGPQAARWPEIPETGTSAEAPPPG